MARLSSSGWISANNGTGCGTAPGGMANMAGKSIKGESIVCLAELARAMVSVAEYRWMSVGEPYDLNLVVLSSKQQEEKRAGHNGYHEILEQVFLKPIARLLGPHVHSLLGSM
jgi:hypothetical protein